MLNYLRALFIARHFLDSWYGNVTCLLSLHPQDSKDILQEGVAGQGDVAVLL
jgi:hypothetical protein